MRRRGWKRSMQQARALDAFAIDGIRHNIAVSFCVDGPSTMEGRTVCRRAFIAEEFPDGFMPAHPKGEALHLFAAVAAFIDHRLNVRKRKVSGQMMNGKPIVFDCDRVVVWGMIGCMLPLKITLMTWL